MREQLGQILIRFRPQLVDEIEPVELLNHLLAQNVLTKRQAKGISCLQDPYKQNEAILDALHRRPDEDFGKFCQALEDTNQKDIADKYLRLPAASSAKNQSTTESMTETMKSLGIEMRKPAPGESATVNQNPHLYGVRSVSTCVSASGQSFIPDASGPLHIDGLVVAKSSEDFYLQNREKSYPMHKVNRGRCVIISNEFFQGKKPLASREGSSVDVENLRALFSQLHFSVAVLEDQTVQQLKAYIQSVATDESLRDDQCFVMFVMSHGKSISVKSETGETFGVEYIYGADGELVSTRSLMAPLTNDNCRQLNGKPKLVFFQACRGEVVDRTESDCTVADDTSVAPLVQQPADYSAPCADVIMSRLQWDDNIQPSVCLTTPADSLPANWSEKSEKHPLNLKDFLIGYPTQSGFRSFRNTSVGSWYINALCRVFCARACDTDVASMLRLVNSIVIKWVSKNPNPDLTDSSQCAEIKDCLTKERLYLFPGIQRPDK